MAHVYPNCIAVVRYNGQRIHLRPGQQWDSDDPFVRDRPEFFTGDSNDHARSAEYQPVEQATRSPGERRPTRRTPKPGRTQ